MPSTLKHVHRWCHPTWNMYTGDAIHPETCTQVMTSTLKHVHRWCHPPWNVHRWCHPPWNTHTGDDIHAETHNTVGMVHKAHINSLPWCSVQFWQSVTWSQCVKMIHNNSAPWYSVQFWRSLTWTQCVKMTHNNSAPWYSVQFWHTTTHPHGTEYHSDGLGHDESTLGSGHSHIQQIGLLSIHWVLKNWNTPSNHWVSLSVFTGCWRTEIHQSIAE